MVLTSLKWRRWWRSAGVGALLACLASAAHADLFVSNLGGGGDVRRFTDAGAPLAIPFIQAGLGGEGVACTTSGAGELYVANNTGTITVFNATTDAPLRTFATVPGAAFAALDFSADGSVLYAADYGSGRLLALRTSDGSIANSVATSAAHDVRVAPDGTIVAADFRFTGVEHFDANLNPLGNLIPDNDHGLSSPSGMTFDANGHLWVSNFVSGTTAGVYGYAFNGTFLNFVPNDVQNQLLSPFGLDLGPDGAIYVAVFGNDSVARIDSLAHTVTTLISNEGARPKYLRFSENCCDVAVPEPDAGLLLGLGLCGLWLARRRGDRGG